MLRLLNLVKDMFDEGYEGSVSIIPCASLDRYKDKEGIFIKLGGFAKNHHYLTVNDGKVEVFDGYDNIASFSDNISVSDIVLIAADDYKFHKNEYPLPKAFEKLFIKYGYMKKVERYEFFD